MFSNSLKPLFNNLKKGTIWFYLALVLTIMLLTVIIINAVKPVKEGFEDKKEFVEKKGEGIYDDFYASVYDSLVYNGFKNDYEVGEIVNLTSPSSSSSILDLGAGTGHHVNAFKNKGFNCIGIDQSREMIKVAKENYPDITMKVGDFMKPMQFQPNQFTHITSLYFTIYYVKDKRQFFENCYTWLKPGGYLVLHLVNREKFDPIIPAGDPFAVVSPQKFADNRITTSNVVFNDFRYKSQFDPNESGNNASIYPNDVKIFKEVFKYNNGSVRQNTHEFYMSTQKDILEKAKSVGFIEIAQIDMIKCQYENQYLYILQKPN